MAKFDIEFDKVVAHEGGYVNDPDDNGGETYMGISRKANPKWDGWALVDKHKKEQGASFKTYLKKDTALTNKVKRLYKSNYWDVFELDDIPSQKIANQLFDTAVNMGISQAVKLIQETLGLKVTGKWCPNLKAKLMKI